MSCNDCKTTCCSSNLTIDQKVFDLENKVLLMGNPNVGKSVIFTALTGIYTMSSNYAGTTVSYTQGKMIIEDKEFQLIDVPGTYSLTATSEAEQVAVSFMESGAKAVICVLDASNLTRNLNLALEVKKHGVPIVFALNLSDIAERKGIKIDIEKLSKHLNAPVISTVAVKKDGMNELKSKVLEIIDNKDYKQEVDTTETKTKELWNKSFEIAKDCITKEEQNLKFIDKLGEKMLKPWPGIAIALLIVVLSLVIIVFGGKGIRAVITTPLVNSAIIPFFEMIIGKLPLPEIINNILIGEYGIFVIGFQWLLDFILPFVFMFYLVFTFLEDSGVLPRMAVLFDNVMRKMGLQGGSLINFVMGYGCAVPAIIGTRNCTTRKERIIISTMVCFAVPCISQLSALISLVSSVSYLAVILLVLFSFLIVFIVSAVLGKLLKGKITPIVIEIPNLLMPEPKSYFRKFLIRMKSFLVEAEIPMLVAVGIIALLQGVIINDVPMINYFADVCSPIVSQMLGLPKEAATFLLLGVIRREFAVLPLLELNLNTLQVFVAAVVSLLYLPCISVFGVLAKELKARVAVGIFVGTFTVAILLGTIINLIGSIFM